MKLNLKNLAGTVTEAIFTSVGAYWGAVNGASPQDAMSLAAILGKTAGDTVRGISIENRPEDELAGSINKAIIEAINDDSFELPYASNEEFLERVQTDTVLKRCVFQPEFKEKLKMHFISACERDPDCDIATIPVDEIMASIAENLEPRVFDSEKSTAYTALNLLIYIAGIIADVIKRLEDTPLLRPEIGYSDAFLDRWNDAFNRNVINEDAVDATAELIHFMDSLGDRLSATLAICSNRASQNEPIGDWPDYLVDSNTALKPLVYAKALMKDVEYRARCSSRVSSSFVRDRLACARDIIVTHREKSLENADVQEKTLELLKTCELLYIDFLRQKVEKKAAVSGDELKDRYIVPCLDALERLNSLNVSYGAAWFELKELFFDGQSAVLSKIIPGKELAQAEYDRLAARFSKLSFVPGMEIPAPVLPPVKAAPDSRETEYLFPVFSGAFDSVAGKDPDKLEQMEFAIFSQVVNGKTVVLQGSQIADNYNLLRLLHTDGFRSLCEEGYVVFSAFGRFATPMEFLLDRLRNPNFIFSSFEGYGITNSNGEHVYRDLVLDALENKKSYRDLKGYFKSWPEMETLYDGYRIMDEVFPAWKSVYFHQDPEKRKGNLTITHTLEELSKQGLYSFIDTFVEELKEDEGSYPVPGRAEFIHFMENHISNITDRTWTRSHYYDYIKKQREQAAGHEDREKMFDLFQKIVDRCYIMYNGKLSCDDVRVQVEDDILQLHRKSDEPQNGYRVDFKIQRYQAAKNDSGFRLLRWADLIKDAENAKEQAIAWKNKALRDDEYKKIKQEEHFGAELMYKEGSPHQECEITGYSCKTSRGNQYEISTRTGAGTIRLPDEQAIIDEDESPGQQAAVTARRNSGKFEINLTCKGRLI